jgi:hypothetical protein
MNVDVMAACGWEFFKIGEFFVEVSFKLSLNGQICIF